MRSLNCRMGAENGMAPSLGRQSNPTRSTNASWNVENSPGLILGVTIHSYYSMSVTHFINLSIPDVELIIPFVILNFLCIKTDCNSIHNRPLGPFFFPPRQRQHQILCVDVLVIFIVFNDIYIRQGIISSFSHAENSKKFHKWYFEKYI